MECVEQKGPNYKRSDRGTAILRHQQPVRCFAKSRKAKGLALRTPHSALSRPLLQVANSGDLPPVHSLVETRGRWARGYRLQQKEATRRHEESQEILFVLLRDFSRPLDRRTSCRTATDHQPAHQWPLRGPSNMSSSRETCHLRVPFEKTRGFFTSHLSSSQKHGDCCHPSSVSCQLSVVSCQLSVVSCQLSVVSCQLSVVSWSQSPVTSHNSPTIHEERILELTPSARIRSLLERGGLEIALFFRVDRHPGVTQGVIFGAVNRVFQACAKNPIAPD